MKDELYKVTVKKSLWSTYEYYVVAKNYGEAENIERPKNWAYGEIEKIELVDAPVLVKESEG